MVEENKILRGLIAAPFTPFDGEGRLSLHVLEAFSRYLAAAGVKGVFVGGTTGEFPSLSITERKQLTEAWATLGRQAGLAVVVHVGDNNLDHACELAAHSAEQGVDGIALVPPHYFIPADLDSLLACIKRVAERAGALPVYYYDIPGLTGVKIPCSGLLERAIKEIPNFRGLKFSNGDLVELQRCLAVDPERLNILFGCDEMLLAAQSLGIDGAVGSTYNYLAPLFLKMLDCFKQGNLAEAQQLQLRAVRVVELLERACPLSVGKLFMRQIGFDFGSVRLPLKALTQAEEAELSSAVQELGVLEGAKAV